MIHGSWAPVASNYYQEQYSELKQFGDYDSGFQLPGINFRNVVLNLNVSGAIPNMRFWAPVVKSELQKRASGFMHF